MKITVPDNVINRDPGTGEPVLRPDGRPDVLAFGWWLEVIVLNDPRWSHSYKSMRSAATIDRQVRGCAPGDVVELELADWEALRDIVDSPQFLAKDETGRVVPMRGYVNPLLGRLAFPFIAAVIEARA